MKWMSYSLKRLIFKKKSNLTWLTKIIEWPSKSRIKNVRWWFFWLLSGTDHLSISTFFQELDKTSVYFFPKKIGLFAEWLMSLFSSIEFITDFMKFSVASSWEQPKIIRHNLSFQIIWLSIKSAPLTKVRFS